MLFVALCSERLELYRDLARISYLLRQVRSGEEIRKFFVILFLCFSSVIYGERYTVLVAICSDLTQARFIQAKTSEATAEPVYVMKDSSSYKVKVGFFSSPESAKAVQTHLQKKIGNTQFIVKRQLDPPDYSIIDDFDYDKQYTIVVGFCLNSGEAELVKKKTLESTDETVNIIKDINYYKIEVGSFFSPESARAEQINLQKRGGYKGFIEEKKIERRSVARSVSSRSIFPIAERPVSKTKTSVPMAEKLVVTAPVANTSVTVTEKSVTSAPEKDTVPAEKTASFVPVKESKGYGIQIYAFVDRNRAVHSVNKYEEKYGANTIPLAPYNKVIAGDFKTKEDAKKLLTVLKKDYPDAFITKPQVVQVFKEVTEKPETETKPTVEQKPVVEVKPVVQKPVLEQKSTVEQKPTTEPKQVTVQKPVVVEKPAVEQKPVKEERSTQEKPKEVLAAPTSFKTQEKEVPQIKPDVSGKVSEHFYVEVDVFREKGMADQAQKKLQQEFTNKKAVVKYFKPYYKVVFTDFRNVDEAMEMVFMLQKSGYGKTLLIFE